ncbi:cytoplasmic pattern recognition receptor signaling pathway in response to virus [Branchiostoma belcheri]|nr:cytoplasmic pattern recognition receptor signaling pathway in response to virus [Branchiostoma belcheri]
MRRYGPERGALEEMERAKAKRLDTVRVGRLCQDAHYNVRESGAGSFAGLRLPGTRGNRDDQDQVWPKNVKARSVGSGDLEREVLVDVQRRIVLDLSFPPGRSGNSGIRADFYMDEPYKLQLPGYDAFERLIRSKGPGCLMFKRDLSRAYRQIPVAPHDYDRLGFRWDGKYYFDVRRDGLSAHNKRRAMHRMQGHDVTNYIDDFGGVESPPRAQVSFHRGRHLENEKAGKAGSKSLCRCVASRPPRSAYWQVKLDEESSKLTTFNTVAMLQRARDKCVKQSIVVAAPEVGYFGHNLTKDGLKPDHKKVDAITSMKAPTNKAEVMTMLGMVNYLAKFTPKPV